MHDGTDDASLGSLRGRRAAANGGADAIPPNSPSRSIEVHGRKQAPFYPVHSRQRERWTDGAARCTARAARDATGRERERVYTRSSLVVCISLALATSPSHSLALPLSLERHFAYTVPTRVGESRIHPNKNSPDNMRHDNDDVRRALDYHHFHTADYFTLLTGGATDVNATPSRERSSRSGGETPTRKENRNCIQYTFTVPTVCLLASRTTRFLFSRGNTQSVVLTPSVSLLSFPGFFPPYFFFFLSFSFQFLFRETRT